VVEHACLVDVDERDRRIEARVVELEPRDLAIAGWRLPPSFIEERMNKSRYSSVMKFEPEGDKYAVFRMTYSGRGGWSYPLALGKLRELAMQFVPPIGTEGFFDLF
jgi:hypothetical protein